MAIVVRIGLILLEIAVALLLMKLTQVLNEKTALNNTIIRQRNLKADLKAAQAIAHAKCLAIEFELISLQNQRQALINTGEKNLQKLGQVMAQIAEKKARLQALQTEGGRLIGEIFTLHSELRWKKFNEIANWANRWKLNVVASWASILLWVVTVTDLIRAIKDYYDSCQALDAAQSAAIDEANSGEDKCDDEEDYENTQMSNIMLEILNEAINEA